MMIDRRHFSLSTGAVLATLPGLPGCAPAKSGGSFDEAVARTWRHGPPGAATGTELQRELVRYATLAPSSHNTQCWRFRLAEHAIHVLPDLPPRAPYASAIGLGARRPDLVVRFGRGPKLPPSLRRPVQAVLV